MSKIPESINNLIEEFNKLPGIGPKTAEKFVFYLIKQSPNDLEKFSQSLLNLKNEIKLCNNCFNFSSSDPCKNCSDSSRDNLILCIVAEPADIMAIEKTNQFNGKYFVLGGVIDQPNGIGPEQLRIKELENKLSKNGINEVIVATNPDMEGETTALYLSKLLKKYKIKTTRIARGLPMGGDIEYADEITLSSALENRKEI